METNKFQQKIINIYSTHFVSICMDLISLYKIHEKNQSVYMPQVSSLVSMYKILGMLKTIPKIQLGVHSNQLEVAGLCKSPAPSLYIFIKNTDI